MICQYANLRIEMRKNMLYNDVNTEDEASLICCQCGNRATTKKMEVKKMTEKEKELFERIRNSKDPDRALDLAIRIVEEKLKKLNLPN